MSGKRAWQHATAVAVAIGVTFSVLLVSVSFGVSYDIHHRLDVPGLVGLSGLDIDKINTILAALTIVVTASMLTQTAVATYTQGVHAMSSRSEEIAIRRQSGVLRSRLVGEFLRGALWACAVGGAIGEIIGIVLGLVLRTWTPLPVRFGPIALLGAFPVAVGVALAAAVLPAWRAANASPALLRRS